MRINSIVPTPFAFFTIILTNSPLVNQKMKKYYRVLAWGRLQKNAQKELPH